MGIRSRLNKHQFLIIIIFTVAVAVALLLWYFASPSEPPSPISPVGAEAQAVNDELDYLDLNGVIEWYEGFYVWNPKAQYTSYPFITGTVGIYWDEPELGIQPLAVPLTDTPVMTIELVLSSTTAANVYSQVLTYTDIARSTPGTGLAFRPIWEWWENEPGIYNEYIKGEIDIGAEVLPMFFVSGGQVITPTGYFKLYREDLSILDIIYMPVVMKRVK